MLSFKASAGYSLVLRYSVNAGPIPPGNSGKSDTTTNTESVAFNEKTLTAYIIPDMGRVIGS